MDGPLKENAKEDSLNDERCQHENVKQEGGFVVCQDCGMVLDEELAYEENPTYSFETQREYERKIHSRDKRAKRDPKIKEKYDRIKTLEIWFRDYKSSFYEQKKSIDLLKGYNIGQNIDKVKYQAIKSRYLKYNKQNRKTYQNMVIIFLAIVWMEIKDTTTVRIERYIEVCKELGHKINKKMLYNAMRKVQRAEEEEKRLREIKSQRDLEREIKKKIKILFQKDLNKIPFEEVKDHLMDRPHFERLKIAMLLRLSEILKKIAYREIHNLNYKAFTAGLMYYIGQTLKDNKIFIQVLIKKITKFSTTTIRKKYKILKQILGPPSGFEPLEFK